MGKFIQKAMVALWNKTPWGRAAIAEAEKKLLIQAEREAAIKAIGPTGEEIAKKTVGTKGGGMGGTAISILIGIGVGLAFPGIGLAGELILTEVIHRGGSAAIGVMTAPGTPTPEPTVEPTEEPSRHEEPSEPANNEPEATPDNGGTVIIVTTPDPNSGVHEGTSTSSSGSSSSSNNGGDDHPSGDGGGDNMGCKPRGHTHTANCP